ncbi:MAG: hypothetical protein HYR73_08730 [Candidatus Eisenbacteria bacterium]|nr:hypothetical protein [Candidatus Eisenbacteria bacterium]
MAAVAIAAWTLPAAALGPVDATLGYDFYSAADGRTSWAPMGELSSDLKACVVSAGVSHVDDNSIGMAWGFTGGVKFRVAPHAHFALDATGFASDSVSGAWKIRTGPEFDLGRERTLGVFFSRYDDNLRNASNGVSAEFDARVVPRLSGSVSASIQRAADVTGGDVSAGASWHLTGMIDLTAEGGVSVNGTGLQGVLPGPRGEVLSQNRGPGRGRPGGGSGTTTSTTSATSTFTSAQLGVRVNF